MKLLKDTYLYAIKVDYFMLNSETDEEYTESLYLSIDTETKSKAGEPMNLIIFKEEINPHLRVFDTEKEAEEYLDRRGKETCCYENGRVIKIKYNCDTKRWEEV